MVISLSTKTKTGEPTGFAQKLLDGSMIHALRLDEPNLFMAGANIQFFTDYGGKDKKFVKRTICTGFQCVFLRTDNVNVFVEINDRRLYGTDLVRFYQNEGFSTLSDFIDHYRPICQAAQHGGKRGVEIKLIHWTNFRY